MQLTQPIKDILASRQPPFPWHERWDSTNIVRILVAEEILAGSITAGTITVTNNFFGPAAFIGPDPPPNPTPGQLWWRNDPDGVLYVWYDDGSSLQWAPCTPLPQADPTTGAPIWADDPANNMIVPVAVRGIRFPSFSLGVRFEHSTYPTIDRQTGIAADDTTLRIWAGNLGIYFFRHDQSGSPLGQVFNDGRWAIGADPTGPLDVATKRYVDAHAGGGGGSSPWTDGPNQTLMPVDPTKLGIQLVNTARVPQIAVLGFIVGTDAGHPSGYEVAMSISPTVTEWVGGDDMYLTPQKSDMALWIGQASDPYGCVGIGTDNGGGAVSQNERLMVAGGVQIGSALHALPGTLQFQAGRFQGRNNAGAWVYLDPPIGGEPPRYYLLSGAGAGQPSAGLSVGLYVAAMDFTWPVGLPGCQGKLKVAPAALASFDIRVNGVSKGSMKFAVGATVATFTLPVAVSMLVGDVIEIFAPTPADTALSDPAWTLRGDI